MVLVALAIRLVVVGFLYTERTDPARDHWRFGGESGRIARSIALGEGFSSPLFAKTGPTAWLTPVYLTHPEDYYRRPIDPLFVVLAAYAITSLMRDRPQLLSTKMNGSQVIHLESMQIGGFEENTAARR
jgi:hypothetical protein